MKRQIQHRCGVAQGRNGQSSSAASVSLYRRRRRPPCSDVSCEQLFREIDDGYHRFWSRRGGAPKVETVSWQKY